MKKNLFNHNTDLCVDVKTILRSDSITKIGKDYQGVLRRDEETHYVFTEIVSSAVEKRNPRIFSGKYINITRRDDGSLKLNFKELRVGPGFNLDRFALGVYNELSLALGGLIEEA